MKSHAEKIHDFLEKLDSETTEALLSVSTIKTFGKGSFLLRQDEVCRRSYVVENGILRKFYLNEGKEITTEFYFSEDLAVSLASYVQQEPGHEFIQALTETRVSVTDYAAFQEVKQRYPVLLEFDLLMTEAHALWLESRLLDFHTLSATQRYQKLLSKDPRIIQHIPLTPIASYLGISLETLSRIRSKL